MTFQNEGVREADIPPENRPQPLGTSNYIWNSNNFQMAPLFHTTILHLGNKTNVCESGEQMSTVCTRAIAGE